MLKEIIERCCIRKYSDKKINDDVVKEIVKAGISAPSWMNVQPWHFIIVEKQETKDLLSQASGGQKQVKDASHIIVVLGDYTAWNDKNFAKVLSERGNSQETIDFILSNKSYNPAKRGKEILLARTMEQCSYAMAFMNLQAQNMGTDTCIIGAFANELTELSSELQAKVKQELNIPDGMFIAGLLTLGYRADNVQNGKKIRKQYEDVVSTEKFGNVK